LEIGNLAFILSRGASACAARVLLMNAFNFDELVKKSENTSFISSQFLLSNFKFQAVNGYENL